MKVEEWERFVNKVKKTVEANPDLDEANTKSRIISPLISKLGWNPIEGEVRAEYPIKFATRTSHVDYALLVGGSPAVFVEAKPLRTDLNSAHAKQLIDYGRHKSVNWCVLTNGRELRIYNSAWVKPEKDAPQDALVEALKLDELIDKLDIVEKISKESIESGNTEQVFKQIKQFKDTVRGLKENRDDIESSIEGLLSTYAEELVKDKISKATTRFVNELIEELAQLPRREKPSPPPEDHVEPEEVNLPVRKRKALLEDYSEGTVMVTPSSPELKDEETGLPSGVGFFKEYCAWGFVRVGSERDIKYLALYVTSPESAVKYFGRVDDILDPKDPKSPVRSHVQEKEDLASWNLEEGKKIIVLEEESVVELADPIKLGTVPKGVLQGMWYTSLERFAEAEVTDDLKT